MRKFLVQGWYKDLYGWEDISEHDTREEANEVADEFAFLQKVPIRVMVSVPIEKHDI